MSTATATHEHTQAAGGCCGSSGGCSSGGGQSQGAVQQLNFETPVLNPYKTDPAATDAPIKLSDKAAVEIKRFMSEKKVPDGCVLRVAVLAGGCSGFQEHLGFDTKVNAETDHLSDQFGIRVAIDKKFIMFLAGTTIDYLDGIDKRGFKFDNPNAKSSCGCGKSFSV
jgi:iron-sulfur cluster assembly protein